MTLILVLVVLVSDRNLMPFPLNEQGCVINRQFGTLTVYVITVTFVFTFF